MDIILIIIILLFSVISHEVAHGYIAYRFGDNTARDMGRLTFNPLPHIDFIGTLLFPLILIITKAPFLIGWAKPVPVNPYNLRKPERHHLYVSLAGIAANLFLAILCTLCYGMYINIFSLPSSRDAVVLLFNYGIQINVILAVFNMLPIPPLDGSWILYHLLPARIAETYKKIFPYGFLLLILLLMTNSIHFVIVPLNSYMMKLLSEILKKIII